MASVSWLQSPPVQAELIYLLSLMRIGENPSTHRRHTGNTQVSTYLPSQTDTQRGSLPPSQLLLFLRLEYPDAIERLQYYRWQQFSDVDLLLPVRQDLCQQSLMKSKSLTAQPLGSAFGCSHLLTCQNKVMG